MSRYSPHAFTFNNLAVPIGDEEHMGKKMRIIHLKKYIAVIFVAMLTYSCANAQTFVVADIVVPDNVPEKHVQEVRKTVIGTEIYLLFSDNDVRMTAKPKGKKTESMILKKMGDNLYRGENGCDMLDLELNTIWGYIRSCKITTYDKKSSSSSMVWSGTMTLKRK